MPNSAKAPALSMIAGARPGLRLSRVYSVIAGARPGLRLSWLYGNARCQVRQVNHRRWRRYYDATFRAAAFPGRRERSLCLFLVAWEGHQADKKAK